MFSLISWSQYCIVVAIVVVLMRLVTTSPAMGITSIQVKDATNPPAVAAQAQADLRYPRLDPKP